MTIQGSCQKEFGPVSACQGKIFQSKLETGKVLQQLALKLPETFAH
jgi:hypothetical protein